MLVWGYYDTQSEALDHVELGRSGVARRSGDSPIEPRQLLAQDAAQLGGEPLVAVDEVPQTLRNHQNPLPVGDLGQEHLGRPGALDDRALGVAGGAGQSAFARERHEEAELARAALEAHHAVPFQ